jgi:hypothetical protein
MGKKSGSGINNSDHISESIETIFGLKYLNSLVRIQEPRWKKFGSEIRDEKIRIRDKHPASATLTDKTTNIYRVGQDAFPGFAR